MSSELPSVFIIIVNWNGWEDTVECLQSIEELTYSNYSVVVVDNGSTDHSVRQIRKQFENITLIESENNRGFAGGNNLGIKHALKHQADYVWLLNNDTVVDSKALTALVKRVDNDPEIGMCGSKLIYHRQRDIVQALAGGKYNKWLGITRNIGHKKPVGSSLDQKKVENELQYIVGASMLVSRAFITHTGLLSEEYFLYYEELDWAVRGWEKFTLGFAPESLVYHKEGASTGGRQLQLDDRSKTSDYYQLKNRLKFTLNYFPLYFPVVYLTIIYAIFNRMKRGQWSRIPMIIKLLFTFNK